MDTTTPDQHASSALNEQTFGSYRKILMLSGPLILSQMGVMLMQLVDAIFLARYSEASISAIGPAGMTFWLFCGLFIGLVGYTNTFVAQYVGARQSERVGAAVWQGIYLAIAAGAVLFGVSFASTAIFDFVGHAPDVRQQEIIYFRILCYGGITFLLSSAISGFYAGRHDNMVLMLAHIAGGLVNAALAYALIFGHFGAPEMGVRGAAWATIIGHIVQVAFMGAILFKPAFRRDFSTWAHRAIDLPLMWRMCRYGFPNGVRYIVEIGAWTAFLLILGKVNPDALAATNIAWRINGMAFFPVIGLSIAVAMLVGQAQGAGRPDLSRRVTFRGMVLGEVWMASAALLMVVAPNLLLSLFFKPDRNAEEVIVYNMCVKLLWFVAIYSVVDNLNIIFMSVLSGAGDTRWMLITSGLLHAGFFAALLICSHFSAGTYTMWLTATIFICLCASFWVVRYRSGAWESKRVIEHAPPDVNNPAFPGPDASQS